MGARAARTATLLGWGLGAENLRTVYQVHKIPFVLAPVASWEASIAVTPLSLPLLSQRLPPQGLSIAVPSNSDTLSPAVFIACPLSSRFLPTTSHIALLLSLFTPSSFHSGGCHLAFYLLIWFFTPCPRLFFSFIKSRDFLLLDGYCTV